MTYPLPPSIMSSKVNFSFNQQVFSKVYKAGPFVVTREMLSLYANAVGEKNPLYGGEYSIPMSENDKVIAPPALAVILIDYWEPPDLELKFEGVLYLAGYWVEPLAPIMPGDTLMASIKITDVYPKTGRSGPMVFLKKEATFTNQKGVRVSLVGASSVWRN